MVTDTVRADEMGFSYRHSGTKMLAYAANYVHAAGDRCVYMTKEVYPAVGKHYGITSGAAERRMRTACHAAGAGQVAEVIRQVAADYAG